MNGWQLIWFILLLILYIFVEEYEHSLCMVFYFTTPIRKSKKFLRLFIQRQCCLWHWHSFRRKNINFSRDPPLGPQMCKQRSTANGTFWMVGRSTKLIQNGEPPLEDSKKGGSLSHTRLSPHWYTEKKTPDKKFRINYSREKEQK